MLRWSGRSGKLRPTIDEKMVPLIVMKGCQRIFCKQVGHINAVSVPYSLVKKNLYIFRASFSQIFLCILGGKIQDNYFVVHSLWEGSKSSLELPEKCVQKEALVFLLPSENFNSKVIHLTNSDRLVFWLHV